MVQVRDCLHWSSHVGFPNPCLFAQTKPVSSAQTRGWRRASCCSQRTSIFRTLCRFSQRYLCQMDARRAFSHERWKTPTHLGSGLQCSAQFVARLAFFMKVASRSESWEHRWSFQWVPHTRAELVGGKSLTSFDYLLVSTLVRRLMQKCEVFEISSLGPTPRSKDRAQH